MRRPNEAAVVRGCLLGGGREIRGNLLEVDPSSGRAEDLELAQARSRDRISHLIHRCRRSRENGGMRSRRDRHRRHALLSSRWIEGSAIGFRRKGLALPPVRESRPHARGDDTLDRAVPVRRAARVVTRLSSRSRGEASDSHASRRRHLPARRQKLEGEKITLVIGLSP